MKDELMTLIDPLPSLNLMCHSARLLLLGSL